MSNELLNIGGKKFTIPKKSLEKIPFFEKLFKNKFGIEKDENGYILINNELKYFGDVFSYIQSDKLCGRDLEWWLTDERATYQDLTNTHKKLEHIMITANYFGIDHLANNIKIILKKKRMTNFRDLFNTLGNEFDRSKIIENILIACDKYGIMCDDDLGFLQPSDTNLMFSPEQLLEKGVIRKYICKLHKD